MWRLAEGDRTAFRPVFALVWPQVRAFAARLVGPADGEDAAQAALLKIFSRASEYDRARDALPWVLGIAAWECRTLRRRWERRREQSAPAPGRPARVSCAFAAVLLPLVVALAYAGGSVGRAVIPGLESGAAALAMPLLVGTLGRACFGPACMFLCLPACVVGGALAGAFIARRAAREEREPG